MIKECPLKVGSCDFRLSEVSWFVIISPERQGDRPFYTEPENQSEGKGHCDSADFRHCW